MVNACPEIVVKSFLLVLSEHTDGGMEVARILPVDPVQQHVFQVILVVRMGGAVLRNYPTMVAPITKKPGINVRIVIAPMVQALAVRLQVEILQLILALIPHVYLDHAVACLQVQHDLSLAFLMQPKNALLRLRLVGLHKESKRPSMYPRLKLFLLP